MTTTVTPGSFADRLARATDARRAQIIARLPVEKQLQLAVAAKTGASRPWWFIGRPEQFEPPGDWRFWVLLAGRGFRENSDRLTMDLPEDEALPR